MTKEQTMCSRCIMDKTVLGIKFDDRGECQYCKIHDRQEQKLPLNEDTKGRLEGIIKKIKEHGKNKKYDCVVGVSGGRDSTYTLLTAVKLGLKPLAVHLDNGWDSEIAVSNIHKATSNLGVDLHTVVLDWEEFKDVQIAFLKASVPDGEIPSDIAILGALYKTCVTEGIGYIITGHSFRTEGNAPIGWTYMDGRYIKSVHNRFGKVKMKTFTNLTLLDFMYYLFIRRIKHIRLMEYIDYRKSDVDKKLEKELGWKYYGGHHYESVYTRFFQSHILLKKFNIDRRKTEYSALIRSGQITRKNALEKIREPPISREQDEEARDYVIKKLGLTRDEFEGIMSLPLKTFHDYPTYYSLIKRLRIPIMVACGLGLIPQVFYEKYFIMG